MGKKGSWFSSLKKTLSPRPKDNKSQKSEQKGFVEEHPSVSNTSTVENTGSSYESRPFPPPEEVKPLEVQAEPSQIAILAPTKVAVFTTQYAGKSRESREEIAAIKIQTIYRGYMARRAKLGLRGLARLKRVVEGPCARRQTVNTLKCIHSFSHLQSQINSRRIRMLEENHALQKRLQRDKELANVQNGDEWDDSLQSKEEIEAKLLSKYDATMRRERAMAYSFTHQQPWKKSGRTTANMLFMDPTNPRWGWSWSERYKDHANDHTPVRSNIDTKNEITKSYARHQLNSAPSTPRSRVGDLAAASPKPKTGPNGLGLEASLHDDTKSVPSVKSDMDKRHSVAKSAMVKVHPRGQGVMENGGAKKRLSLQAKPKRHSGSSKVGIGTTISDGLKQGS